MRYGRNSREEWPTVGASRAQAGKQFSTKLLGLCSARELQGQGRVSRTQLWLTRNLLLLSRLCHVKYEPSYQGHMSQ